MSKGTTLDSHPVIFTSVFIDDRYEFSGNTLATFWNKNLNKKLSNTVMQCLAREINFSETTFLLDSKENLAEVRIFTPDIEIPFAGHPTLGSSFVLQELNEFDASQREIVLDLGIGAVKVKIEENNYFSMLQPKPQFLETFNDLNKISEILSITTDNIDPAIAPQYVSTGLPYLFIPMKSLKAIQSVKVNKLLLYEYLKGKPINDIVIFTKETIHKDSNLHMRMFAPYAGIEEDPATGSAAGPVTAYIEKNSYLNSHESGSEIVIEQGYEINRPSKLITSILGSSDDIKGVKVGGRVKKILEGNYFA